MRTWALAEPIRSHNLFALGVAAKRGDKPTYFYTFFTTADGNLRVYVRAGGPAFDAGLRSGEIIEKLDGKSWWLYGTYQAEQRAYDGVPHTFEVSNGARSAVVQLAAPFVP
jgi:hypothetical protein